MGKARIPQVILETHDDRLAEAKLIHAYEILLPSKNRPVRKTGEQEDVNTEKTDEDNGYLREGLL